MSQIGNSQVILFNYIKIKIIKLLINKYLLKYINLLKGLNIIIIFFIKYLKSFIKNLFILIIRKIFYK